MRGYLRAFFVVLIRFQEFLKYCAYLFVIGFGVVCVVCVAVMLGFFAFAAWRYGGLPGDPTNLGTFFATLGAFLVAGVACFIARRRILRAWPEVTNR